jgi:fibronectin-binding autotransporter adhesin
MTADLLIKGKFRLLLNFVALIAVLIVITITTTNSAHAANFTWTGGGSGANFSTAGNWQGGVAPTGAATDALIFDNDLADFSAKTPNNDLVGADFASITFASGTDVDTPIIDGNAFSVSATITGTSEGNINNNVTASDNLTFTTGASGAIRLLGNLSMGSNNLVISGSGETFSNGVISGSGTVLVSETARAQFNGANTYSGVTTISSGAALGTNSSTGLGTTAGKTIVQSGGTLCAYYYDGLTIAEPIDVAGSGTSSKGAALCVGAIVSGAGGSGASPTITLSGAINLTANSLVSSADGAAFSLSNVTLNGFTITRPAGDGGTVAVNGSSLSSSVSQITISDSQPSTFLSVTLNQIVTLTGVRGSTEVYGTLKGTGTTGDLLVASTGVVYPGTSPGCLTSENVTTESNSGYVFEIGGTTACSQYDQQIVNGTLTVGEGSIFNFSFINGFKPAAGDTFVLFNNDGTDPVSGIFGLAPEGTTGTVEGVNFILSYVGGDGNDVTITVLPGSPAAGISSRKPNAVLVVGVIVGTVVVSVLLVRRKFQASKR